MIDAGTNNVIYMELYSGPKMVHGKCRKTKVAGTIDRGSTVFWIHTALSSAAWTPEQNISIDSLNTCTVMLV
jgi:hypothetical protein